MLFCRDDEESAFFADANQVRIPATQPPRPSGTSAARGLRHPYTGWNPSAPIIFSPFDFFGRSGAACLS